MMLGQQPRLGLAKAHRATAATALHLAHEEDPHPDQQQEGEPVQQHGDQDIILLGGFLDLDINAGLTQQAHGVDILRRQGRGQDLATTAGRPDLIALDDDLRNIAALHPVEELRIGHLTGRRSGLRGVLQQLEQGQQQHQNEGPDRKISHLHA